MSLTPLLNWLHRRNQYRILISIIGIAYFLKGFGFVGVRYRRDLRAYEFNVNKTTYLSIGPGWAYCFKYLKESLEQAFCARYVPKKGDCVIDIGAGLGEETVIFAQLVGPTGNVLSVEANPVTFEALDYLCKQNSFDWVRRRNLAIFNCDGTVKIEDDKGNYLKNTIVSDGEFSVQALTLDSLVEAESIEKIDFLKCNIEGAEQFLIQGMDKSVHIVRHLCISCHDFRANLWGESDFYRTKEKVKEFLLAKGFDVHERTSTNAAVNDLLYAMKRLK